MRARKLILLLLFLAALATALMVLNAGAGREVVPREIPPGLPYRLETIISRPINPSRPFFVADVDRDGNDDVLLNAQDRLLWYRFSGREMILAGEGRYEHQSATLVASDVDGDGYLEYLALTDSLRGCMLSCYDWFSPDSSTKPRYAIGPLFSAINKVGSRPWKRMGFYGGFPATGDRDPMMFVRLNPRRGEDSVRSVMAWDGRTGKVKWRFPVAQGQDLICDDFGTGVWSVVLTTVAIAEKPSVEGLNPRAVRLVCLDMREGSPLWEQRLGGLGGRAYLALADVDSDGRNEMLVSRSLVPGDSILLNEPHAWNIAVMNGDGKVLRSKSLTTRPEMITVANIDDDSRPEFLVGGDAGELIMLDDKLDILRVAAAPRILNATNLFVFGVGDLAGDGNPRIVCSNGNALIVRDSEGNILAQRMFTRKIEASDVALAHAGGDCRIVVSNGETVQVLALRSLTFLERARADRRGVTFGALTAVLVGVVAFSQFRRLRRWRRERGISFDAELNELLTAMSAYYHGGASLKIMDRIRFNLKNWDRIRSEETRREGLLAELHRTFTGTVVPELRHLVILARRARVPEEIWRTLLFDAELAGKEIEATAAGSGDATRQGAHVARALQALDDADESIARIRAHLRSVFRVHAGEALGRVVDRFREEHAARGVSFVFAADVPAADVHVFISPVSFDKIIESLLTNAVRATEGRSGAEIDILTQEEGDYLRIDVRDNGCGIPRDDWDRVFDRAYTTKAEGGGFGLHYAREELAKFQGKLYVLDSGEGAGTTMRVILRKSGKVAPA